MAVHKVAWNAGTRTATILLNAAALPAGSVSIGTYEHHEDNTKDPLETKQNHVHYHHVRDLLYKQKIEDMQSVTIVRGAGVDTL